MRSRKINNIWFNSTKKKIFRVGERGALLFLMNSVQYKHIYKLFMSFSLCTLCIYLFLSPYELYYLYEISFSHDEDRQESAGVLTQPILQYE